MREFLWEGMDEGKRSYLVSWQVNGCPVKEGGFEIGNLRMCNKALLAKWLWRFVLDPKSLWHRIIVSKYGFDPFQWVAKGIIGAHCTPWKDISLEVLSFYAWTRCIVGDGKETIFLFGRSVGWG